MKKIKKALALVLALAMVVTAFPITNAEAATTAKLSAKNATINVGGKKVLTLTTPSTWKNVKTSWKVGKKSVAKIVTTTKKCSVRAQGVGSTNVKVTVTYAKSTKKGAKRYSKSLLCLVKVVDPTAEEPETPEEPTEPETPAEVSVSATLTNPSYPDQEELQNAVLIGNKAVINVKAVKNGEPVVGETVLFASTAASSYGDEGYYRAENASAVTNANGVATFVFGFTGSGNVTQPTKLAAFNYTATLASSGDKVDGTVMFVIASLGDVNCVNYGLTKTDAQGNNGLEVSKNYNTTTAHKGLSWTLGTQKILPGNVGLDSDYVDSQQTSKTGSTTHQVTFDNYLPKIYLPGYGTATSEAKRFSQDVNYTSGEYHTYTTEKKIVALTVSPKELTWAHVNFTDLQLSKDTKLHIKVYGNEAKTIVVDDYVLNGEREQSSFTYSIPLKANTSWEKLYVETYLESYGRVDDDKNGGYTIKDITGVYKTQTNNAGGVVELKNAKVTWSLVTAPMNEVKTLSDDDKLDLAYALQEADTAAAYLAKKITYQTPAFPYTGNAILKKYDENGNIESYFVCPTKNDTKNKNVLSFDYKHCYRVSKEEAERQVGEIIADTGKTVTVNSEHTGVSTLEGKVTDLEGNPIPGFDAANDTVYTSVQWNPLPEEGATATTGSDKFYALLGQTVQVVAQLTDANGDAVSEANKKIDFKYGDAESALPAAGNVIPGTGVTVVSISGNGLTDPNGQVVLKLQSAQANILTKLKATAATANGFKVALKIKDKTTSLANIEWIDADLIYEYVQNGATSHPFPEEDGTVKQYVRTESTVGNSYNATSTQTAYAGTNWEYAMKVGTTSGITINGIKIAMTSTGVGTVSPSSEVNGMAKAYSNKTGDTQIIGKLNASSIGDNITLTKNGESLNFAGEGPTNLDKQLTINVNWQPSGIYPNIVTPNGTRVVLGTTSTTTTLFVSVVDKFKNPNTTKPITVTADNATLTFTHADGTAENSNKIVITSRDIEEKGKNGVVAIDVTTTATTESSTIVTATVENETVSSIINWVKAVTGTAFIAEPDQTIAKQSIKGDTVTLTFTKNIVASSVYAGAFQVGFASGTETKYDVTSAVVSGKTITLKIKNGPTTIPANTTIKVYITNDKEDPDTGIKYTIHSVDGDALAADTAIEITDK